MILIEELQKLCADKKVKWTTHVAKRLQERGINPSDVKNAIFSGEIVEQYPKDYPFPSCLIFGSAISGKFIHTVVGMGEGYAWIITAYFPTTEKWADDLKTRKEIKK